MGDTPLLIKVSGLLVMTGATIMTLSFILPLIQRPVETFSICGGFLALAFGAAWLINRLGY